MRERVDTERARHLLQVPTAVAPAEPTRPGVFGDEPDAAYPPLRTALIGYGRWGMRLLADSQLGGGVNVVSVCDTHPAHLRLARENGYRGACVADARRVLDDAAIEAVIVAIPTPSHASLALDALAAGKHVYLEVPLAADVASCRAIVAAARQAKTVLVPGLQRSMSNIVGPMKRKVLASGARYARCVARQRLPRPADLVPPSLRRLAWRSLAGSPGLVAELAAGSLDLVTNACRMAPPFQIHTRGYNHDTAGGWSTPDTVDAQITDSAGKFVEVQVCGLVDHHGLTEEIETRSRGQVAVHGDRGYWLPALGGSFEGWEVTADRTVTGWGELYVQLKPTESCLDGHFGGDDVEERPLICAFDHFRRQARGGPYHEPMLDRALAATLLALRIHEASLTNATITVSASELGCGTQETAGG